MRLIFTSTVISVKRALISLLTLLLCILPIAGIAAAAVSSSPDVMKAIEKSFEEEHVNQKEIIYYIPNVIPDVTIGSINDRSSAFPFDAYKELSVVKEGLLYGL